MSGICRAAIAAVALTQLHLPAGAADIPATSMPQEQPAAVEDSVAATRSYLELRALLLGLRTRFDVIGVEQVAETLVDEALAIGTGGPSPQAVEETFRQLRAEGSYYIVSLQYLIMSGGAAWPEGKSAAQYEDDAGVLLAALQDQLDNSTNLGIDPWEVFIGIDRINAWVEGYPSLEDSGMDHFGDRADLVDQAMRLRNLRGGAQTR